MHEDVFASSLYYVNCVMETVRKIRLMWRLEKNNFGATDTNVGVKGHTLLKDGPLPFMPELSVPLRS